MTIAAIRRSVARPGGVLSLMLMLVISATALAQNNVVYVESNIGQTTNQNSVFAFVNSGGKLTQLKGSPYPTMGTGVYSSNPVFAPGFQADQEILVNSAGTLLFAVNGHSDTITTFNVNSDGSLNPGEHLQFERSRSCQSWSRRDPTFGNSVEIRVHSGRRL
jgi:6-phosphogluconolactonase (cycloisomerase 2 family)